MQLLFLLVTMLIGGFWHGAEWKFIFWGAAHGVLLIIHKLWINYKSPNTESKWIKFTSWFITFNLVSLLWIPFRANSMEDSWVMYKNIFTNHNIGMILAVIESNPILFVLLVSGFTFTIMSKSWKNEIIQSYNRLDLVFKILLLIIVIQGMIQMKSSVVQPFIYFQF